MAQDDPETPLTRRAPPKKAVAPARDVPAPAKSAELAPPPRHRPGDVVGGKYRLEGLLGQGGAGDVWLAHNDTLDIDVAVKVIRGAGADSDAAQRLLTEARAAARLGHPAIVRILDFGRADGGEPFIVMERLTGEDLSVAVKRRGKLSAETAVRTLLPIAHALSVAHGKRIVHRDLKPENIFLAKAEGDRLEPKIVDFGIAQMDAGTTRHATAAGTLLGSPAYMSPEQTRGADVDHRTDVWSFCVVLYETATGKVPFAAPDHASQLVAIVDADPVPITELGAGDAALWAILSRGLAKDPDQRYQTIRQVGEALAAWLGDKGIKQDITGASLDATWRNGLRGTSLETLNSLPPPPNEPSRESVQTVFDDAPRAPAALSGAPSRAVLVVAVLAGVMGIVGGVSLGTRFLKKGPEVAARASASAPPVSSASGASAPEVAPSSQSAAQPPTSASASQTESPEKGTDSVRGGTTRAGKASRPARREKRPPPALKDPFE